MTVVKPRKPFVAEVVWHSCSGCGTEWPFPFGTGGYANRVWHCPVCAEADSARRIREMREELEALKRRVGA